MKLEENKYSKNNKIKSINKEKEELMALRQAVLHLLLFRSKKNPEFMKLLIQQVTIKLNNKDKIKELKILILSKVSHKISKIDKDHPHQIKDHHQKVVEVIRVQSVVLVLNLIMSLKDLK